MPEPERRNPIDVTAQDFSGITLFSRALEIVLKEGGYGSVVGFAWSPARNRLLRHAGDMVVP